MWSAWGFFQCTKNTHIFGYGDCYVDDAMDLNHSIFSAGCEGFNFDEIGIVELESCKNLIFVVFVIFIKKATFSEDSNAIQHIFQELIWRVTTLKMKKQSLY